MKKHLLSLIIAFLSFCTVFIAKAQVIQLGTGTTTSTTSGLVPFTTLWEDNRSQYLILASEIVAAGGQAGEITSLAFRVSTTPGQTMNGFNIRLGNTTSTSLNSTFETVSTLVYSANLAASTVSSGDWRTLTFQTPFFWNGTSNILVEVCFDNGSFSSNGGVWIYTPGTYNASRYRFVDGGTGCALGGTATTNTARPQMRLNFNPVPMVVAPITGTTTLTCGSSTTLSSAVPAATGGTVTTLGNVRVHSFTTIGSSNFAPNFNGNVQYLVVGGGGAGGLRFGTLAVTGTTGVVVGDGGVGLGPDSNGADGESSSFGSIVSLGGGGGGTNGLNGRSGGSGGGGSNGSSGGLGTAGQGFKGGDQNGGGFTCTNLGQCFARGCGGGGAGAAGANTSGNNGSAGGAGVANSITGTSVFYAGGGGGGTNTTTAFSGGIGGGGAGGRSGSINGVNGTPNTGGGGGGGGAEPSGNGGNGGSGIVVVRYAVPTSGTWSSSNPAVATVNPSTGEVTAVGSGSTNITYTATNGVSSQVVSTTVTVTSEYAVEWISATWGSASWCVGQPRDITVTVRNIGTQTWSNNPTGNNRISMAYKWNADPWFDSYSPNRFLFSNPVAPGQTATITISVQTPNSPQAIDNISFNLVKEIGPGACWFNNCCATNQIFTSPAYTFVYPPALTVQSKDVFCTGETFNYSFNLPTGGSITESNGYRYHTFTTNGTFTVPAGLNITAEMLVVGGGGGGGANGGGGGGAGEVLHVPSVVISPNDYTITIGQGGLPSANSVTQTGFNGGNTIAGPFTAIGGGGGGSRDGAGLSGRNGGSGGGGGGAGASGNQNPGAAIGAGLGSSGGFGIWPDVGCSNAGGGGGGAGGVGTNAPFINSTQSVAGNGGPGVQFAQFATVGGSPAGWFGGGGGGNTTGFIGCGSVITSTTQGTGGIGGGGNGFVNGTPNTGGGGGGGAQGGSGIVIIRYPIGENGQWSSSNPSVASINSASGQMNTIANGSTTITYAVDFGGCNFTYSKQIFIQSIPQPTASNNGPVCVNTPAQLTAQGLAPGGFVANQTQINSVIGVPSIPIGNSWTLEAWSKFPLANLDPNFTTLFRNDGTSGGGSDHHILLQGSILGTWRNTAPATGFNSSGFDINTLSPGWHHIAAVGSGGVTRFYIDGNFVGVSGYQTQDPIQIIGGCCSTAGGSQAWGTLDNIRIWNTAKTQGSIIQDMYLKNPTTNLANLIAQYSFDNGDASCDNNPAFNAVNVVSTQFNTLADNYTYTWSGANAPSPSTSETQTTANLTVTGNYSVVASASGCSSPQSAQTTVNVLNAQRDLPTGPQCSGTELNFSAFGGPVATTYSWNVTAPVGATANPVSGSGSTFSFIPTNETGSDQQFNIQIVQTSGAATCSTLFSPTIRSNSIGGTTASDQTICAGDSPSDLTLTGNVGSIQWQFSNNNISFVDIPGATSATLTSAQMGSLLAERFYRAVSTASAFCPTSNSSTTQITVLSPVNSASLVNNSTINATIERCVDNGWTYYSTVDDEDKYVFAINKNGNTFTAEVELVDLPGTSTISQVSGVGPARGTFLIGRYWNVNMTGTINPSNPVSIRFFVDPAEVTQAFNEANALLTTTALPGSAMTPLTFFKAPANFDPSMMNNGNFTFVPDRTWIAGQFTTGTLNGVTYYEMGGITSFSGGTGGFSVNDGAPLLPVELMSFTATSVENRYVRLDWSTATEINNEGFEVQRSLDGINFETIGWVEGNGNSVVINTYSYNDMEAVSGINYYRLKQIDFDGEFEYTYIVSARLTGVDKLQVENVRPNPAENEIYIDIDTRVDVRTTFTIYNHMGQQVDKISRVLAEGRNEVKVNTSKYATGAYYVTIENNNAVVTKKFVISR